MSRYIAMKAATSSRKQHFFSNRDKDKFTQIFMAPHRARNQAILLSFHLSFRRLVIAFRCFAGTAICIKIREKVFFLIISLQRIQWNVIYSHKRLNQVNKCCLSKTLKSSAQSNWGIKAYLCKGSVSINIIFSQFSDS